MSRSIFARCVAVSSRLVLLLAAARLASGCASHPETIVLKSWMGTERAHQSGYMHFVNWVEETPDVIRHDAIIDEATLRSFDDQQACIDLVERTAVGYDEPIDALSPHCASPDIETSAAVSGETVSVMDYDYTTQTTVLRLRAATAFSFAGLSLRQPTDNTFRVIERRALLCCPTGGKKEVTLSLKSPRLRVNDVGAPYHQAFGWTVQ